MLCLNPKSLIWHILIITRSYVHLPASFCALQPRQFLPNVFFFSIAGSTVSKLRASLDSDTVDKLVFLNKRFKSVPPSVEENGSVSV